MTPDTTLAEWLSFEFVFLLWRVLSEAKGELTISNVLMALGSSGSFECRLPGRWLRGIFSRTARLFVERRARVKAQLCAAFLSGGFSPA